MHSSKVILSGLDFVGGPIGEFIGMALSTLEAWPQKDTDCTPHPKSEPTPWQSKF